MGRAPYDATSRGPAALAAVVVAAVALLAPSLLVATVDGPATVSLAVAALVVVALVRLADHGVLLAACFVGSVRPAAESVPRVLSGRITDPTHHPLRPRAPGTV
jgi:chromate transport protein ChrA